MIKAIATAIWNTSEMFFIPLGIFAPFIFGLMIDRKPNKID